MSAMERTTYRRSLGSNAWAFDEPRRDPQHAPHTSGPSTDFSSDDSIPLFLSDPQGRPDPREFAPLAPSQRTSILMRVVAGGLVVSAFAILVAVGVFSSNVTRVLIDEARAPMGGATEDQSAMQAASTQPAVRQIPPKDPALVSDPATLASVNASSPRLETPSREAIVSAYHTALQSQAPAARTGNEAAAPSKTLDAETLAARHAPRACWRSATSPRRDCCLNAPPMRRTQLRLSCWHKPMIRLCSECAIREASHPTL